MLTENDKNIMMSALDSLYEYQEFRDFLEEPDSDSWWAIDNSLDESDISLHAGATKGVVVIDECNFVIKLPFSTHDFDYCRAEWRNYLMAVNEGIGDCFAETHFLTMFHGMPVYAQEFVECDECETSTRMYEAAYRDFLEYEDLPDNSESRETFADEYCGDNDWQPLCYEYWDDKTVNRFVGFCDENMIGDLHSANWSAGEKLKALDFSGFSDISRFIRHNVAEDKRNGVDYTDSVEYKWFRICDLAMAFNAA